MLDFLKTQLQELAAQYKTIMQKATGEPLAASSSITASVGNGGTNTPADVLCVQKLLNQRAGAGLTEDGKCGAKTIAAIAKFQQSQLQMAKPDGRIDAGGRTWKALTGQAVPPPPAATTNAGSNESPKTESSMNVATGSVHDTPPAAPTGSGKLVLGSTIESGMPGGRRPKEKEVTREMSQGAVHYLNFFCKKYPSPAERKAHYGEFVRFWLSDGREVAARFEEHTWYGKDLSKAHTPHPGISLFAIGW